MTSPFKEKIQQALDNPSLQVALDDNAERRRTARLAAFASLNEDTQVIRRRAHDIREEVIKNLDRYLEQFCTQAQANGLVIHHAADASQAVNQVLEIIRQTGGKTIVKSKTMVGEELEINAALEKAGYQVTETDLGEWLVQLRGERPAHILTPAVHLNRQDVARLFESRFGLPYTEDVAELTAFARKSLRQAFLQADVGISGVNFGVAENGALCLVTNEGNGRMATTLPQVHIALMGIERMVPRLEDLAVMLAVLPRASAGQKMSVYTTLIQQPRQPGEQDGASERHVILIDNRRSALRASALNDILYCIRCGSCLNACPVFREIGGHAYVGAHGHPTPYSGPIGSVLSAGLFGAKEFTNLARASSLCGACQDACPVDIPLPELLLRVRAGMTGSGEAPGVKHEVATRDLPQAVPVGVPFSLRLGLKMYSWLASSPQRFHLAQKLAGRISGWLAPRSSWLSLPAFTGWGYSRSLPRPASQTFQKRWGEGKRPNEKIIPAASPDQEPKAQREQEPAGQSHSLHGDLRLPERIARFRLELEAVGGRLIQCHPEQLAGLVLKELEAQSIDQVIAWEDADLPDGLLPFLKTAGISITHQPEAKAGGGLTGVLAAVAETGTLLLHGGAGRPSSASLLAPVHLAILQSRQIYTNLAQVVSLPEAKNTSSLTMITGPSRTADIEMSLTIGVHGPREVIVFCVGDTEL
jgi:L-lactate dehydrogenase complex protein LldF